MAHATGVPRCCLPLCAVLFLGHLNAADNAAPLAPRAEYEGKIVTAIRWEPPSQPLAPADLARIMPFHYGMRLTLAGVREAIKRLYSTGDYSSIEVETEPAPTGVVLIFRTTEQWFIGPVDVHGKITHTPNRGQLMNAARLNLGTAYSDSDLQRALNGMRRLLQRNGLYLAEVNTQVRRDRVHHRVAFTFHIDSGKRAKLMLPVVIGDTRIPASSLARAAKFHAWLPLPKWKHATEDNVQSGLQNIRKKFEKADRLTADVSLSRSEYVPARNRVLETIQADGGPKVKIKTSGAKISRGKLEDYVPVFDEETVNRDLLVTGARNLHDYYQGQGYFDAQVDFHTSHPSPDEEDITYTVELGLRHKLVKVAIKGNRYFSTDDIRDRMYLEPAGWIHLRHGRYSQGFLERDEDAIRALYRDNGFQDCKVISSIVNDYLGRKGQVAITIDIQEGVQYKVSSLQIHGIVHENEKDIEAQLGSLTGQPYSLTSVGLDRDTILRVYQSAGYPEASFDSRVALNRTAHTAAVQYFVTEGQPRYVREVLISGLHSTRQRLVRPNILLKPGDPLSWTAMGDMQRRLYNLGVFDKVDMAIQNTEGDTEDKYVLYNLTEGHRYYLALGFGAEIAQFGAAPTNLSYPTGVTGFAPRGDLEISRLNLWGLGHSLNLKSRFSTLDRRASLQYLIPRFHNVEGRDISVTGLYDDARDVLTFFARRIEGSAQISQRLSKPTTLLLRYTWRDVVVQQSTLKINPLLIPLESTPAHLGIITGTLVEDRRDNPTDAHTGIYNSLDFSLIDHDFGGNRNFTRFLGRSSWYHPIGRTSVLASNTQFGWIHAFNVTPGVDPFDYVPIAERFFAGGPNSDRGFPYEQAGPRDPLTGFPIGGNALLFHTTELRFPLMGPNIGGVIFHDMGNVYTDLSSVSFRVHQNGLTDFNYMVHAVGFGIRYKTPVGPVALDLAYSINPPTFHGLQGTYNQLLFGGATPTITSVSHFQFFFSIGQAF